MSKAREGCLREASPFKQLLQEHLVLPIVLVVFQGGPAGGLWGPISGSSLRGPRPSPGPHGAFQHSGSRGLGSGRRNPGSPRKRDVPTQRARSAHNRGRPARARDRAPGKPRLSLMDHPGNTRPSSEVLGRREPGSYSSLIRLLRPSNLGGTRNWRLRARSESELGAASRRNSAGSSRPRRPRRQATDGTGREGNFSVCLAGQRSQSRSSRRRRRSQRSGRGRIQVPRGRRWLKPFPLLGPIVGLLRRRAF